MKKGNIIFLHGTSNTGKTTLEKELQERLEEPYFALDEFYKGLGLIPDKYRRGDFGIEIGWQVFLMPCQGFIIQ